MLQKIMDKLNDLRPRQLLILAGGAALIMFLAIYTAMKIFQEDEAAKQAENKVPTVQVVVAKVNIPSRTRIQETMLQLKEMPVDIAPEGAIKSFKDVLDVQVKVSIFAGDILTVQKVFAEKSDEGFIATIPLDSRAVSISVNDITSVAGFAKPGDFVDLLLVEKSQYSATTTVILQNVQLLSINKDMTGTSVVSDAAAGAATTTAINNPSIATFALRPEDVLKLVSASKLGEIYMSLRPSKPRNMYVGETEYTIESINAPQPEPEPAPAPVENPLPAIPSNVAPAMPLPQLPATQTAPTIEIIQGDQVIQEAGVSAPATASSLPVIPSGVQANVPSQPVVSGRRSNSNFKSDAANSIQDTALSNSRVAQSFAMNN